MTEWGIDCELATEGLNMFYQEPTEKSANKITYSIGPAPAVVPFSCGTRVPICVCSSLQEKLFIQGFRAAIPQLFEDRPKQD